MGLCSRTRAQEVISVSDESLKSMMARILQRHKDSQVSNVDIDTVDRGTEKAPIPMAPTLQEMGREHDNDTGTKRGTQQNQE